MPRNDIAIPAQALAFSAMRAAHDLLSWAAQRRFTAMKKLLLLSLLLLSTACATGYQPADESLVAGGFTELRLGPDKWHVIVEGNDFSSRREINQFLLRRCAELTLEHGQRYFTLEDQKARIRRRIDYDGILSTTPRNEATMTAVATQEKDAFDAVAVIEETNEVAEGRLSARAQKAIEKLTNAS
jgi:hypothetical protein